MAESRNKSAGKKTGKYTTAKKKNGRSKKLALTKGNKTACIEALKKKRVHEKRSQPTRIN